MTKSKQRQGLGGTVLIMILTVMFVLIIMLMATLTVVTTASQRIYTKFEENQAYYTSRSALEVFTTAMLSDNQYLSDDGSSEQQGYQLQKALYTIKSKDGNDQNTTLGNPTKEYIEYTVTLPRVANGADAYGDFADDVTLRMEVLERIYDPDDNRADDSMVIKITAESTFNDVEGSASVLLEVGPSTGANNATRAVTSLGGSEMEMNNFALLGGLAMGGNSTMGNQADIWGNVYLGGSTSNGQGGSKFTLVGKETFYVKNGVTGVTNGFPLRGVTNAEGQPVVFIDGNFDITQSNTDAVYDPTKPVPMVVAKDFKTSGAYISSGDLYVMGDFITGSQVTINGDLYLAMSGTSSEDGIAELILGNTLTVNGDVHLLDGSKIFDLASQIDVVNLGTVHVPTVGAVPTNIESIVSFDTQKMVEIDRDSDPGMIIVTLPGVPPINIKTDGYVFNQYRRNQDPNENWISASEYAFTDKEELKKIVDPDDPDTYPEYSDKRIHEYFNEHIGEATVISYVNNPPPQIHSNPGFYYLQGLGNGQEVIFDVNGEVELFIDSSISIGNNPKVIVNPGTTLKVYCLPGQYNFNMLRFTTPEVEAGNPIYVGDYAPAGSSLADIRTTFYVEGNSEINLYNDWGYIIGHIYAPYGSVNGSSQGNTTLSGNLYYNGEQYTGTHGFAIVGSVLANNYIPGSSAKGGVAFVNTPEENTPPPVGETFLNFQEVKYSRN